MDLDDVHITGTHASVLKALLCSSLAHLIATDVKEAGIEGGWEISDHMLGENLHRLVLHMGEE